MTGRTSWLRVVVLGSAVALSLQSPALAATVDVTINNVGFQPKVVAVAMGDTVRWTNTDDVAHTVSSQGCPGTTKGGVGLFCSDPLAQQEEFAASLKVAAQYPYECTIHPAMTGTVQVALEATPPSGGLGTKFTIKPAKDGVPSGYNADVQIKRPGSNRFVNWFINIRTASPLKFRPDAGVGPYQFRSRLQSDAGGGASDWSPIAEIVVS